MTQQPYYPPQYPQAPQQPQYPQQAYPTPVPQQVQQPFPGVQAPPVQPQQPLPNGTLDDYYSQPTGGSGPSVSWANKPDGTTVSGIVARDVTDGDVVADTDPKTQAPKFYRDGRPKFVMKVPLKVQPSQEFPEGEATLYVRGQMRDELVRAMNEAGASGAPKGGDALTVTLTHRKPSRGGGNPMNVFAISYQPAAGGTGAPSPAPVPQQQAPAPQAVQQYPQQPQAPAQQAQQAPPAAPSQPPAMPEGFSPEQQQLLAQLTGQQQG